VYLSLKECMHLELRKQNLRLETAAFRCKKNKTKNKTKQKKKQKNKKKTTTTKKQKTKNNNNKKKKHCSHNFFYLLTVHSL